MIEIHREIIFGMCKIHLGSFRSSFRQEAKFLAKSTQSKVIECVAAAGFDGITGAVGPIGLSVLSPYKIFIGGFQDSSRFLVSSSFQKCLLISDCLGVYIF